MGEKAPLGAKREAPKTTPLLVGGVPHPLTMAPSWAKGALLVPEGLLRWRKGVVFAYIDTVMCENNTFSCRRVPLLAEGSPLQLRGRHDTRKGAFLVEGRLCWREGPCISLEGRRRGRKGCLLFSGERLCWREGTHITPSV